MNKEKVVIFGAGKIGKEASVALSNEGKEVLYFIDNNKELHGMQIAGVEVIGIDDYVTRNYDYRIIIACALEYQLQIEEVLKERDVTQYSFYDRASNSHKERLISYAASEELEDVILYHVFKDAKEVFYIDVGSNDPFAGSVTKLLYDMKNANGINIEPIEEFYTLTCKERPRDITIQTALGAEAGRMKMYVQSGLSTLIEDNMVSENVPTIEVSITTLKNVCEEYIPDRREYSFLKVDVEGFEKEVLLGADFSKYRPNVIVMESTLPNTSIPCYDNWEYILLENDYHFAYKRGVNRYYIANEHEELNLKFLELNNIDDMYDIYSVGVVK